MDTLDLLSSDEHGFSVELLINGRRLSAILESEYGAIPYWLLAEGLPVLSTPHDEGQTTTCIVAVCNCGEYGCGHIQCDVWKTPDRVTFTSFHCDNRSQTETVTYHFSHENYNRVMTSIVHMVQHYHQQVQP